MSSDLLVTLDSDGPIPGQLPRRGPGRQAQVDAQRARQLLATDHGYSRLIIAGDGPGLEQHGFGLAKAAREAGVAHVRLLTSPGRLTGAPTVRAVVLAGVDEFCVALHGPDAALHDALAGSAGSFAAASLCLGHLRRHPVQVTVDLVVCASNLARLGQTVALAIAQGAHRLRVWPYGPGGEAPVELGEFVELAALIPALREGLAQAREAGVAVQLRHVPPCLLGPEASLVDNGVPDALDGVRPGRPLAQFNCLHEARCEAAEACLGLHHGYVNAHGWERERLQPIPRERPWRERDRSVERRTGGAAGRHGHGPWLALLGDTVALAEGVALTRIEARYPIQMPDGTRFDLLLTAREEGARRFTCSRSFNISYTDVEGPAAELEIAAYLQPVFDAIVANDDGSLCL